MTVPFDRFIDGLAVLRKVDALEARLSAVEVGPLAKERFKERVADLERRMDERDLCVQDVPLRNQIETLAKQLERHEALLGSNSGPGPVFDLSRLIFDARAFGAKEATLRERIIDAKWDGAKAERERILGLLTEIVGSMPMDRPRFIEVDALRARIMKLVEP